MSVTNEPDQNARLFACRNPFMVITVIQLIYGDNFDDGDDGSELVVFFIRIYRKVG